MKIWALFSVENNYDQPDNNLVAWWATKPTFEILSDALECPMNSDKNILAVVKIAQGAVERIGGTDYRLREIEEGVIGCKP